MARLPELRVVAEKFDLKIISIEDLVAYRMEHDSLIKKKQDFQIETRFGDFRLRAYQQTTNDAVHIALTKGTWSPAYRQTSSFQVLRTKTTYWLIDIGFKGSIISVPPLLKTTCFVFYIK